MRLGEAFVTFGYFLFVNIYLKLPGLTGWAPQMTLSSVHVYLSLRPSLISLHMLLRNSMSLSMGCVAVGDCLVLDTFK